MRKHLGVDELRRLYVEANLRQRLSVVQDRIQNPHHDPNLLIAYVSAVEGFARSLVMHLHGSTKEELSRAYPRYRNTKVEDMITEYLDKRKLQPPADFVPVNTGCEFQSAVQFRNVLVHEGTYLEPALSGPLIEASRDVLRGLSEAAGLTLRDGI